jgi:homoserine kinase
LLIPGYDAVKVAAKSTGAIGVGISGSGPTMFALCSNFKVAEQVAVAMMDAFKKAGLTSQQYISKLNHEGARVISNS